MSLIENQDLEREADHLIVDGQTFPMHWPDRSYEAAQVMLNAISEKAHLQEHVDA
jgi:hypothetical protein